MMSVPLVLTLLLILMWILLNTFSVGQLLLGAIIAVALMKFAARVRPVRPKLKQLHLAIPLLGHVLIDVLRSNVDVGRIVIGMTGRSPRSGFIDVPLDLRDPHGLAILAAILTSTPGTAWSGVSEDGRTLTLHILDLKDEAEWIQLIKTRYEQPLVRIFQ